MPSDLLRRYWDACLFLSYINAYADRLPILDGLFAEASERPRTTEIITSTLSIAEVAFALYEQTQKHLDRAIEERIDRLWADRSILSLVEFHELVARDARNLIRQSVEHGWSLKANDAIHLATAQRMRVDEFFTYDSKLDKFSPLVGLPIKRPYLLKPQLPGIQ